MGRGSGKQTNTGAQGRGAQAQAAAAPAVGSAKNVATLQKDAKAAGDVEVREGKSGLEESESGPEDAEARALLNYKTDKSAGSCAYKKHLRAHPDEVEQARQICKQTISNYRSLLLGKGLRLRGLRKLSPMQKKR